MSREFTGTSSPDKYARPGNGNKSRCCFKWPQIAEAEIITLINSRIRTRLCHSPAYGPYYYYLGGLTVTDRVEDSVWTEAKWLSRGVVSVGKEIYCGRFITVYHWTTINEEFNLFGAYNHRTVAAWEGI